jgi:hypothetical protein
MSSAMASGLASLIKGCSNEKPPTDVLGMVKASMRKKNDSSGDKEKAMMRLAMLNGKK